ncbi:MAG: hypothetical protein AAGJ19_22045 [Myxococcota bacterium]
MAAIQGLTPANDGAGWGWNDSGTDKAFGLVNGTSTGKPRFAFDTRATLLAGDVVPVYAKDQATAQDMANYSSYNETTGRLTISGTEYVMVLKFDGDFYRIELQVP